MTGSAPSLGDRVVAGGARTLQAVADGSLRAVRRVLFPVGRVPHSPRRILVHLVGNVGDIVVATPMLQALSDLHPDAHITLLTSAGRHGHPGAAELLRGAAAVDEIHEYDVDAVKGLTAARALVRRLRMARPDLIVLCPTSLTAWRQNVRNLCFARAVGARFVVGSSVPTIRRGLGAQVRVRGWFRQETVRYLALLEELGDLPERRTVDFGALSADSAARVASLTPPDRFVAICPGGKQVPHRWPEARFVEVVQRLAAETDLRFVAIGSPAERELCARVLEPAGERSVNAAGALDLRESTELLRSAALLITNDTGPMHLAAVGDVPIVAVFGGAMPPGRWYPWGSRATVLRAEAACPVCLDRPESPHCVERIDAASVLEASRDALAAPPSHDNSPRCRLVPVADSSPVRWITPTSRGWVEVPAPERTERSPLRRRRD